MTFLTGIAQVRHASVHADWSPSLFFYNKNVLVQLTVSTADWWKSMKQLLPSKMVETEDSVRYSSSEVGRLTGRGAVPRLHAEPAGKSSSSSWPELCCFSRPKGLYSL